MKRFHIILLILLLRLPGCPAPDCSGAIPPIASGYGADSAVAVAVDSLQGRFFHHDKIYCFRPGGITTPLPLIYFFPGIGANERPLFEKMLRHIASRGYCVLLVTYKMASFPYQNATYRRMFRGIREGGRAFARYADTSRLGMIGHSFGASAIPSHLHRCMMELQWGGSGAFMYLMAPHFVFRITQKQLLSFPPNVNLIIEVFEDDDCNDNRIAKDIFQTIGIPDSAKEFIILRSDADEESGCRLVADHATPNTFRAGRDTTNALDYYGIWRFIDALADYTFTGNAGAKNMALGNGTPDQQYMGTWPDNTPVKQAIISDGAPLLKPESFANFHWRHPWNVRRKKYRLNMPERADSGYGGGKGEE